MDSECVINRQKRMQAMREGRAKSVRKTSKRGILSLGSALMERVANESVKQSLLSSPFNISTLFTTKPVSFLNTYMRSLS